MLNEKWLKEVKKHASHFDNTMYCACYGSQNYGLATENSDVDTKTTLMPKPYDLLLTQKWYAATHTFSTNDNESLSEVKDVRNMVNCLWKANFNFVETLFTPYYWVSPRWANFIMMLRKNNEAIAHYDEKNFLAGAFGAHHRIYLKKNKNGKNVSYLLFFDSLVEKYMRDYSYIECLKPDNTNFLLKIKKGHLNQEELNKLTEDSFRKMELLYEQYNNNKYGVNDKLRTMIEMALFDVLKERLG